jgi:hypothetical protein
MSVILTPYATRRDFTRIDTVTCAKTDSLLEIQDTFVQSVIMTCVTSVLFATKETHNQSTKKKMSSFLFASYSPYLFFVGGLFQSYIKAVVDHIFQWFISQLFVSCQVTNEDTVRGLDNLILQRNVTRVVNKLESPQHGNYLYWNQWCPVLMIRKREGHRDDNSYYLLYLLSPICTHWAVNRLQALLTLADGLIPSISKESQSVVATYGCRSNCRVIAYASNDNQQKLLDHILDVFPKLNKPNYAILISGPPGVGKSHSGRVLAKYFATEARLFEGCSLSNGSFLKDLRNCRLKKKTIIVFNEVDVAWERSIIPGAQKASIVEKESDKPEAPTSNRMTMCNFMDQLSDMAGIITLYTTNASIKELQEKYPWYTRPGRIDYFCEFNSDKIIKLD